MHPNISVQSTGNLRFLHFIANFAFLASLTIMWESFRLESNFQRPRQKFFYSHFGSIFATFADFAVVRGTETPKRLLHRDLCAIAFAWQTLCIYLLVFAGAVHFKVDQGREGKFGRHPRNLVDISPTSEPNRHTN